MIRYFLGILIAALLFVSCSSSSDNPPIIVKKDTTTTFMVYLPGTNLESEGGNGTRNINDMMKASSSDKLNIIVQTGAANITYAEEDANTPVKDWKRIKRHKVTNNKTTELQDLGNSCITGVVTTDCYEMGSPEKIADFIRYSVNNYPADRYILVLWDHGGGPNGGYGGGGVANIDMNQIMAALEMVKDEVNFDIIGFDACLMGSLEIAYNLRKYGKYLLASEELEPGAGWNYAPPLDAIAKNPNISNAEIGKILIDEFIKYNSSSSQLTLSLVDMSKTEAIVTALDAFSKKANAISVTKPLENWVNIFTARSQTDEYAALVLEKYFYNLIDIGDFTDMLKGAAFSDYNATATALNSALKDAVVYNRTDAAHGNSTGLSIFFPYHFSGKPSVDMLKTYNNLFYTDKIASASFSTSYRDMLQGLLEYANANKSTLDITAVTPQNQLLTATANSNFGIETALMLVAASTVPDQYKFFVSSIARATRRDASTYSIIAQKSDKVIGLNGTPVYMEAAELYNRYSTSVYAFEIPVFVTPAPDKNTPTPTQVQATLIALYDFSENLGWLANVARPLDSTGRDNINLFEGTVITFADVTIDSTGKKTMTPSTTVKPITLDDKGARALKLAPVDILATDKLAFLVRNLKGDPTLSSFFDKDGNPAVRSLMSDDSDEFLQNLADGLNQPIK